jgi:hypothetical protein
VAQKSINMKHPLILIGIFTNAFLKTIVRNNVSVLDFIVHCLLHVSAPIGGHLQVTLIYILCTFYLKMAADQGRNM